MEIARAAAVAFAGYTVLSTTDDGSMDGGSDGLFHRDTRVLSRYRLTIGGARPALVRSSRPEADRWDAVLRIPRPGGRAEGPQLPQDALEIDVRRTVGPGFVEIITVRNHSALPCATTLRIELDADFADVAEVAGEREQRGRLDRTIEPAALQIAYEVEHDGTVVRRGLRVRVVGQDATSEVGVDVDGLRFPVRLAARGSWTATLAFEPLEADGRPVRALVDPQAWARRRDAWRRRRPRIDGDARLRDPFERAADDLFDLRNPELERRFAGRSGDPWVLNAGIPMFTGLFGRDSLTAGWQSALLGPHAALGALDAVAATQATTDDPWRDAEPGKLIHELRSGPLSELGISPRDAYYGSQTTPAMFVLALSELWHWTGDLEVLRRHRDVALRAIAWAESSGDGDHDGLIDYRKRSPRGLRNQGWKDSDEAIRHPDGRIADGPIATVEEQAFLYLALERMAEVLIALDEEALADPLLERADALRSRWHEAFRMDDGFYALALDGTGQQVRSITSNPGHAMGAGIVPRDGALAVADRLLAPDLFSGWGIRSLSADHPSYNPFAYHLGAVWPVEQATFALGFKRYGLDEHVDRLVEGMFAAAEASPEHRLPEALSGHDRTNFPVPIPYPAANSPQAWSASALVQLVQVTLGLYPFAPLRTLAIVRPRLPAFLPEVTLRRVRVGKASVDLTFERRPDGTADWTVVRRHGTLLVVGAGPPDDIEIGGWWERLGAQALRRMPGRFVRAARVAVGQR